MCPGKIEDCTCSSVKTKLENVDAYQAYYKKLDDDIKSICPVTNVIGEQHNNSLDIEESALELEDQASILEQEISSL